MENSEEMENIPGEENKPGGEHHSEKKHTPGDEEHTPENEDTTDEHAEDNVAEEGTLEEQPEDDLEENTVEEHLENNPEEEDIIEEEEIENNPEAEEIAEEEFVYTTEEENTDYHHEDAPEHVFENVTEVEVTEEPTKRNSFKRLRDWLKKKVLGTIVILMLFVMLGLYFYSDLFITVHSGQAGVLYERFGDGTVTDKTYTEGTYFVLPWNRMYLYNVRLQERTVKIEVLSIDGLPIKLSISVRFYASIPTLGVLHRYIGPNYVENVVMPEVESKTRDIISKYSSYELYSLNREKIQDSISKRSLLAINRQKIVKNKVSGEAPNYVVFENLFIERIQLPKYITAAIEEKLNAEQKSLEYDYVLVSARKEADRKTIEANGIKSFQQVSGINILKWRGIEATEKLATSPNSKMIIIGTDNKLPVILNGADDNKKP